MSPNVSRRLAKPSVKFGAKMINTSPFLPLAFDESSFVKHFEHDTTFRKPLLYQRGHLRGVDTALPEQRIQNNQFIQ